MRATEIAQRLAGDVERACLHLLRDGKRKGHEWICGDLDGSAGESLKVHLTGEKSGVWSDFATGESGDMIGLWMQTQNVDLPTACREAMDWLGIKQPKVEAPKRRFSKPAKEGVSSLPPQGAEWVRSVRKISDGAMAAYKLAFKKGALMFPYLRDGDLIAAKYRAIPEKKFWTDADCEPCLFGWQVIDPGQRRVILVEGEFDALAMWDYGMPALSVPFGGGDKGKQQWIDNEFDRLACFDEIVLALDSDAAGAQATEEIAKRLGRERVRVAVLPRKDANQCLIDGIPADEMRRAVDSARSLDPENLKSAADYADAVWAELSKTGPEAGIRLPWSGKAQALVLRPGETSLWAGINGHGKSQVVGMIAVSAVKMGHRACIASLEFTPPKLLRRLHIQAIGRREPTEGQSRMLSQSWRDSLWVFDPGTKDKADTLIETMRYAVKRYGVELFVIDNLSKLGIKDDDYAGQQSFVDRLSDFSRTENTHVALVHHVRKTEKGESQLPEKGDIKGSGGIVDMVDTAVIVWRNKPKEADVRKAGRLTQDLIVRPDCMLGCVKQRNGDEEPFISLWFEWQTYRYFDRPPSLPEYADGEPNWQDGKNEERWT